MRKEANFVNDHSFGECSNTYNDTVMFDTAMTLPNNAKISYNNVRTSSNLIVMTRLLQRDKLHAYK